MLSFLSKIKFAPLLPVLLLAFLSLLTLASLSISDESSLWAFKRQFIWFGLGILTFLVVANFFDYKILLKHNVLSLLLYAFCLTLLILVLFFGSKSRGSLGWFDFYFFQFQPAELAKLALLIILSKYFSKWHTEIWHPGRLAVSIFYTGIFFILVAIQPDLGSAIIFIILWLGLLIASGLKLRHFLIFLVIGVMVFGLGWNYFLEDYQKERITSFFNPSSDVLGAGYNVLQSKISIGSGSWFGRGLGQGIETQLRFLPEAKSDFFLAAFVEEWGFVGAVFLIGLLVWFILSLINIGLSATDNFSKLFIFGYLLIFFSQVIINFGANLGFLPVTGLPLPFLSYGGSNLIIHFLSLGIIQSINLRKS